MDDIDGTIFGKSTEREILDLERRGLLPKRINRFGDHYLKFLLAAPERKRLLLDLLNSTLRLTGYEPLEDIEPMDREISPRGDGRKGIRLDYLGRTASGRIVNLEFQNRPTGDFAKRALYSGSALIYGQLLSGEDYDGIRQTIFVGLLDFPIFKGEAGWYWDFIMSHPKSGKILTRDMVLIFIETPKLKDMLKDLRRKARAGVVDMEDPETRLAAWGGYVTSEGVDILSESMVSDEVFSEVMKVEKDFWGDKRNRFIQLMEERRELDAISELASAKREGMVEGLAKGEAKGKAEGLAEGEARGKAGTARRMLARDMEISLVADITGLSEDEVRTLAE
ncbi:MAG: Rpn family recombination-promoting nuclease/putative transposase [Synergistaceae bacterium]|nr:Rpn family recombination-promoting nuclease/putative transposase [Synergistaceae bacterium]